MWDEKTGKFTIECYVVSDGTEFSIIHKDISKDLIDTPMSCVPYYTYPEKVLRRYFIMRGLRDVSPRETE